MTSRIRFRVCVGLGLVGAITACVVDPLNPQPLPPNNPDNGAVYHPDAGFIVTSDSGATKSDDNADGGEASSPSDSGMPPNVNDAGVDASDDAGDGADAGDSGH